MPDEQSRMETAEADIKSPKSTTAEGHLIYELGYHLVPELGEDQVPAAVAHIMSFLEKAGGVKIAEGAVELAELAYQMEVSRIGKKEKFSRAYFGWIKFAAEPKKIGALTDALKENQNIIRHLLFKTVREDTRIPKKLSVVKTEGTIRDARRREPAEERREKPKMTDEEIDRTIAELVVE